MLPRLLSVLLLLSFAQTSFADCDDAVDLLYEAEKLHRQGNAVASEKWLVNMALQQCPHLPAAHNYLGSLLEDEGNYKKAIVHYKKALEQRPDFSQAWYGLGETYYKQGRFLLSLEAHLHACQTDKDSKARVKALLKSQDYTITEAGKIIDKESLLVLYDKQRRKTVDQMLSKCGLRAAPLKPTHIFRNFQFDIGKASLQSDSEHQLIEIATALRELNNQTVHIHGHTDTQAFAKVNPTESDRLNWNLSKARAESVAQALSGKGVSIRIKIHAHGYRDPLVSGNNPSAWTQNRRVEIK